MSAVWLKLMTILCLSCTAQSDPENQECETPNQSHLGSSVLLPTVISAALLLCVIMGALIWTFVKTQTLHTSVKPRRITNNDVYEDMRGAVRH
ncbi:uncharacterized protein LOC120788060 isoform X2 [Xiphias gladius]|uniref:uncharacterized protein LOC120788060 isoform X2 n=1 Tax=Xiphias gladius TaxID=8245 RepID=UPI001A986436|nr:uncharacterized protein LOC120788060 isoform X2 [Xiphias gladius]